MYREARKHQLACSPTEFLDPVKDRDWLFDSKVRNTVRNASHAKTRFWEENRKFGALRIKQCRLCCSAASPTPAMGFQLPHASAPVDDAHLQTAGAFLVSLLLSAEFPTSLIALPLLSARAV